MQETSIQMGCVQSPQFLGWISSEIPMTTNGENLSVAKHIHR